MTALSRWLPRSLFGRLMAVLAGGLMLAQLLSAAINVAERDRLLVSSFGMQPAQRIADVVKLLDGLGGAERERVVAVFGVPPLVLSLHDAPAAPLESPGGWRMQMFAAQLQLELGAPRQVRVEPRAGFAQMPMGSGGGPGRNFPMHPGGAGMMGHGPGAGVGMGLPVLRTEVQLRDGRWARFDAELPPAPDALPWRLALTLVVLLASMLALSYVAVRWVVRPLHVLAQAAEGLGHDLERAPLPEDGPREVQQAARAFNTMQTRLSGFLKDRTRILAALSHDLKTPLTRMRLRAELLDDEEQRTRFESDLKEMEEMVVYTLEFMRGLGGNEPRAAVDMNALLALLASDNRDMGRSLALEGRAQQPYVGVASLLRRCLANLVDNAAQYGTQARVRVEDGPQQLVLRVLDDGPGIPEDELQRVFEPFYRLEASRSRATGGTGLGLGIARNIARTHGGDLVLRNRAGGGLEAELTLPRQAPGRA